MRITTFASAAVLAVSTAVLVQVGQAPVEQKIPTNAAVTGDEDGPPTGAPTPAANLAEPGAPSTALVNSVAAHGSTPHGPH